MPENSTSTETPSPATATPSLGNAPESRPQSVTLLQAILIAAACSVVSGYAAYRMSAAHAVQAPQVALLDTGRITSAQIEQSIAQPGVTPEQAKAVGEKFVRDLNHEMQRYADAGIVVVNSSAVLSKPSGLDITPDVAASLGVKLK